MIESFWHKVLARCFEGVSGNRRIIFRFENGRAYDADLIDHH